jgi:hypothetical protein
VGQRIPTRTRDVKTPSSDGLLGTFTENTTPTGDQAQSFIDNACAWVLRSTGPLPQSPPASSQVQVAARDAAIWRAAADIELAYPQRDADVRVFQQLDARAVAALAAAVAAVTGGDDTPADSLPSWQSPAHGPWWADLNI